MGPVLLMEEVLMEVGPGAEDEQVIVLGSGIVNGEGATGLFPQGFGEDISSKKTLFTNVHFVWLVGFSLLVILILYLKS